MSRLFTLPFGSRPYQFELPSHIRSALVEPPLSAPARPLEQLLAEALDSPIAAPRLQDSVAPGHRVVIAVSDATRDDPRTAMLRALLARMPADIELTIAVANGTHGPSNIEQLDIDPAILARALVVNHDAHEDRDMVTVGRTPLGTPVRLHRCAVEADWIIATGRIKPHYFAGYGAGCKAIFPGLGANREIRINHQLKNQPGARPGRIAGNPCREDLEEAVAMLPPRQYLLNIILNEDGSAHGAVAGHMSEAFRAGARICEPLYRVRAPRSRLIIVSDHLPLTGSLYQASKLVAAAAELLQDDGTMIVVAECPEGTGPLDTVNRGIYEIGLAPRLPERHRIVLVSNLDARIVAPSYCQWASSVETALAACNSQDATILPSAGCLIIDPVDSSDSWHELS